ncbi:MAG: signal peptidase I, partial [Victivallales bacterium]|nr:signal peptidase I [Victivallales bacterium]
DGFATVRVGTSAKTWSLPTYACRELHGKFVREGDSLWKGAITTGDFIFVNRWKWNFVKPKDGEVMIFSTTGIPALPQGTHYIKRMKARPGETYTIEHQPTDQYGNVRTDLPKVVTMGEGEYFACGDNFNNSFDSRYWGPVPAANLRGCASIVFWPFN